MGAQPGAPGARPRRVADYETVRLLGRGDYGEVWLATPPARLAGHAEQVAVKVLDRPVTEDEFRRATGELRVHAAASARSPHLVRLFDVGLWGDRLFVAMEYLPLGSLARSGLDGGEVSQAVADAARGAHALHEAGLVHRSIKPANVLLRVGGAKLAEPSLAHVLSPGQSVSGFGASTGSVEFIESAVLRGERASRASDVWSLGVTWHRVLSGASVYGHVTDGEGGGGISAVLRLALGSPLHLSESIPVARLEVIRRCLAPDRADRYATALALAEDIDRVEGLVGAS